MEYAMESLHFKSTKIRMNLSKWKIHSSHNVLYITGVSGSGKSTEAFSYAKKDNNIVLLLLDTYTEIAIQGKDRLIELRRAFPKDKSLQIYELYFTKYKKYVSPNPSLRELVVAFRDFFNWLNRYTSDHSDTLFIIEGVHLYGAVSPEFFVHEPFICIMPSDFRLTSNMLRRGIHRSHSAGNMIKILQAIFSELPNIYQSMIKDYPIMDKFYEDYMTLYNH